MIEKEFETWLTGEGRNVKKQIRVDLEKLWLVVP